MLICKMAYYLDNGEGVLVEYENSELPDATAKAQAAIEAARDFESKMGFRPFWADAVEIRKGPKALGSEWNGQVEARNAAIVAGSKVYRRFKA